MPITFFYNKTEYLMYELGDKYPYIIRNAPLDYYGVWCHCVKTEEKFAIHFSSWLPLAISSLGLEAPLLNQYHINRNPGNIEQAYRSI